MSPFLMASLSLIFTYNTLFDFGKFGDGLIANAQVSFHERRWRQGKPLAERNILNEGYVRGQKLSIALQKRTYET